LNADSGAAENAKKAGCISTWGVGMTAPKGWKDAGVVHESLKGVLMPNVESQEPGMSGEQGAYLQYNEYIVYDVAQVRLRYLLRVSM
jgi:poly [ADP-ribose] polymerase 2/3/4